MLELAEVNRLAQTAYDNAQQAQHTAEKASMSGTAHEQLCSERYARINEQLSDVKRAQSLAAAEQKTTFERIASDAKETTKSITEALASLKSKADKAAGVDLAFRYVCLAIGAIGIIWGIYHGNIHVG